MKKELLSPAGDMECLIAAVSAGCNAVYIAGKKFGARSFAPNFTEEELKIAVKYCHLYGVKLYVTVNTIIYENEMNEVLDYVFFLHTIGVDAIIVQDIGLINNIKKMYPDMEIHASTQCHNREEEQFKIMENLGVTRVVLARELSLDKIESIKTPLEKEVFIHGALCISYSGQCLFSSLVMGRSGNRGECAGMCRLPYTLEKENGEEVETSGKYLLSTKELETFDNFKSLMESDITSFKIEGRMKSKEYVYLVTKIYRTLMDKFYNNEKMSLNEEDINNLKIIFNREFTNGHLFNKKGSDLMNVKTPNSIGVELGKVIDIDSKYITIKLDRDLYQEDGIRFVNSNKGMYANYIYNMNDMLINKGKSGDTIKVDNKINLKENDDVRKTSSNKLNKKLDDFEPKKIGIDITCNAGVDKNLEIILKDNDNEIKVEGNKVSPAINAPISIERVKEQLEKLGNTPFIPNSIKINMDNNIFISIKELNELRREAIDKLTSIRENKKKEVIINKIPNLESIEESDKLTLSVLVRNEEQLEMINSLNVENIYTEDINLYKKYKSSCSIYYRIPRLSKMTEEYNNENLLLTELSGINKYKNNNIISDYHLNVVNSANIKYLLDLGVKRVCISTEVIPEKLRNIKYKNNVEVVIYGKIELMLMSHCILNMLVNKETFPCNTCSDKYYLKDRNGEKYPIVSNNMTTQILNYKNKIYYDEIVSEFKEVGIKHFRIDFFDETKEEVEELIKKYKNLLQID